MKKITVQARQNIWDVAVQHCGSAEAAFDIAGMNGELPTSPVSAGSTLKVPDPTNKRVVKYYTENNIVPVGT
ncbi:MAG: hypothetical protein MJ000_04595 [Bacteroidales bacterium]|nr:hypothetical protein [Bacteroidales bacterium]